MTPLATPFEASLSYDGTQLFPLQFGDDIKTILTKGQRLSGRRPTAQVYVPYRLHLYHHLQLIQTQP